MAGNPGPLAGTKSCHGCHPVQVAFWQASRHTQAYATLRQLRQNFNLDCPPCHITRQPSQAAAKLTAYDILSLPPALQTISCESCHGPGWAHAGNPENMIVAKVVDASTCTSCHGRERDPDCDYRQKIIQVRCPAD